jgi:predicted dehydrogenase
LVAIGTPNTSHLELTKQALLAGKHVIVEKPFTITSTDADELIALAKEKKLVLTVNHTRRFDSGHNTIKKVLKSGMLGRLVEYEVHYDRFRPQLREGAWREKDLPGSGILYDLGAHLIDGSLDLFGEPQEVTAMIITQRPGLKVDDNFELILTYPGLKVTLKAGMLVKELGPTYQLFGDKGTFIKYGTDVQEAALLKGLRPENTPNWGEEPPEIWGKLYTDYEGLSLNCQVKSEKGRYQDIIDNIYKAINGEAEVAITPEQARTVIRIIELAFESNRQKKTLPYTR